MRRTGRDLARDRRADYAYTTDITAAIYSNLRGSIRGRGRALTKANARTLDRLHAFTDRMKRAGRRTTQAEQDIAKRYGPQLSGVAEGAFGGARVSADNAVAQGRTAEKVGKYNTATGEGVVDIAEAGAAEAQAGAEALTARALSERATADAGLLAQMRHDISLAELNQQFALEQQREASRLELQQQEKLMALSLGQDFGGARTVVASLADASRAIRDLLNADPNMTWELVETALEDGGILDKADPNQAPLLRRLYGAIKNRGIFGSDGPGRDAEVDALYGVLAYYYPDWAKKKRGDKLRRWIAAALSSLYANAPATPFGQGQSSTQPDTSMGVMGLPEKEREGFGLGGILGMGG